MALVKNKSTAENRDFWLHVEAVTKQSAANLWLERCLAER
jgi:hypothetical protein